MADILALPDARAALRLAATDTSNDADLTATYIPAVKVIVEDEAGPIMAASGRTFTADGGQANILLPTAVTSVASVTENGVTLTTGTDYTVSLKAGCITRGSSTQTGATFADGTKNIVVTYAAGAAATSSDVPANVKLAARMILAQLWQADQQGYRPTFGAPDTDTVMTPSGFAIPRRAAALLRPTPNLPGFA